ncbi:MAG: MarR family transcriptional regulator [Lentisphaeria bacterium]|nr:MarR family transcriptional regulator [Lentisphaeria bacterium]
MDLKSELGRNNDFTSLESEILFSSIYLSKCITRISLDFFATFDYKDESGKKLKLTDMQFNALMILKDRTGEETLQTELSERLLINKSSTGVLLDKLEERGWITRKAKDRRANIISISQIGLKLLEEVSPLLDQQCKEMLKGFKQSEKTELLAYINQYRSQIKKANQELLDK